MDAEHHGRRSATADVRDEYANGHRRDAPGSRAPTGDVLQPAEIAWLALVPCALVTLALIVVLGPTLGRTFLAPGEEAFWPVLFVLPLPEEHGRFLVGLLGPPLLAALVLASARRSPRLRPGTTRALLVAAQATAAAFVVLCFAVQNNIVSSADFPRQPHTAYFTWPTLVVAAALPLLALAVLRRRDWGGRFMPRVHETRRVRRVAAAVAALATALWMLTAINLDSSIGNTASGVRGHLLWTMSEAFAVLNGRTPLVDYHAQYGQLWAYVAAGPMAAIDATVLVYTSVMAIGTSLAVLAIFDVLRRVTRSSLVALALYLPFLAHGFFTVVGPPEDRYGPANLYLLWPIRFAGPCLLAWLTVRHAGGAAPRRAVLLFLVAGLTAINNPDFGLAACAATLAALACATPPSSWRALGRLLGQAAAGLLAAVALVSLATLARSGSLPDPALLFEFSRLYGIGGWAQLPMPELGLYLPVFLTFAAAIVTAAVRVANGSGDRLLTVALAWVGVFGLVASVYYGGRAHPMALIDFFAPWTLAVALLLVIVVRDLAARGWRRPSLPQLAVMSGFALALCSLPQFPAPWSQVSRLADRTPVPAFKHPDATAFVDRTTERGERVVVLMPLGHRIAHDLGLVNVSPYSSIESIPTVQQVGRVVAALRAANGTKLYMSTRNSFPEQLAAFQQAGFAIRDVERATAEGELMQLVDEGAPA